MSSLARNGIWRALTLGLLLAGLAGCATRKDNLARLESKARISVVEAEKIALGRVSEGDVREGAIQRSGNRVLWLVDITIPNTRDTLEVSVDAMTGEVVRMCVAEKGKLATIRVDASSDKTLEDARYARRMKRVLADARFSHPRQITHPYLRAVAVPEEFEGRRNHQPRRVERTARPELHKTFTVGAQPVDPLAFEEQVYEQGHQVKRIVRYVAQADDGTVYCLGEEVDEYVEGKVAGHEGTWLYGVHTRVPGVLLPAHPKVGGKFRAAHAPGILKEENEIYSLDETVTVPTGTYSKCLKVRGLSDGAAEYKYYAPGIGCIKTVPVDGELVLNSR